MHHLSILLPHEDGFSKVKKFYIKSEYYSTCDDYGFNANETWINGGLVYRTKYSVFADGGKVTESSSPYILTRWITTQYKGFTGKVLKT